MNRTYKVTDITAESIELTCNEDGSVWTYVIEVKSIDVNDESFDHEFGVQKNYSKQLDCKVYFSHVEDFDLENTSREEYSQFMKMGQVEAQDYLEKLSTDVIESIFEQG